MRPQNPNPARWGNLRIANAYRAPIMASERSPGFKGEDYIADTHGPRIWTLLCDCGHRWDVKVDDFPGRRRLRSCGRVECPHTPKPKFRSRGPAGIVRTVYLGQENTTWLQTKASASGTSLSRYLDDMVTRARADELISS